MYLLNLGVLIIFYDLVKFTFHYVSIKSCHTLKTNAFRIHLHSTMYILNLDDNVALCSRDKFTFHYVSIKSVNGK